jgi:DNA-dependent RNA polymerase auxiliary subunit epsilon
MAGQPLGGAPRVPDAGVRAARLLLIDREALAREVTDALYAESPDLLARYGAAGREKCLQDMRYHIEHLTPAVAMGDEGMFAGYDEWVDSLLRARNVPTRDVVRCFQLLADRCIARYPDSDAETIGRILRAGLAVLTA